MMDQLLPVVYMIGVLLLVLPAFLQSNSKLKQFLTNLTIWIIVVLIILTIIYIFKNEKNISTYLSEFTIHCKCKFSI